MNNIEWFDWDSQFLLFLQEHVRNSALDPIMKTVTMLGNTGWFWLVLIAVLLIFRKTRKIGLASLTAIVVNFVINNLLIKNLVSRMRPYEAVLGLERIIEKQSEYSFPSGHTSTAFAVSCMILFMLPKEKKWIGIIFLVLAAVISFSRLYVGVHYPTDVIAGALGGFLISLVLYLLIFRRKFGRARSSDSSK